MLPNTSIKLSLQTSETGSRFYLVRAYVARNGGEHGSPYDVVITEIASTDMSHVHVLATANRETLRRDLELAGKCWGWLVETLIDRFVAQQPKRGRRVA